MPSQDYEIRKGIRSSYISRATAKKVLVLSRTMDCETTANICGCSKAAIRAWMPIIERKLGTRLFYRQRGRGHSTWEPRFTADTTQAWERLKKLMRE